MGWGLLDPLNFLHWLLMWLLIIVFIILMIVLIIAPALKQSANNLLGAVVIDMDSYNAGLGESNLIVSSINTFGMADDDDGGDFGGDGIPS
jgi:ABC-type multidrug transport system fused ATPase/permease subunit